MIIKVFYIKFYGLFLAKKLNFKIKLATIFTCSDRKVLLQTCILELIVEQLFKYQQYEIHIKFETNVFNIKRKRKKYFRKSFNV